MTEIRRKLDRDVQTILATAVELQELAWWDEESGPWRRRSDGVPVSGGGRSDPTAGAADDAHKWETRDRIAAELSAVARRLERELSRLRPTRAGECATDRCKGDGWFGGYCDRCDRWRRNNPGLSPADVDGLVEDWNHRLPRFCECWCCPEGCHDRAEEGRSVSHRCRSRMQRARAAEREAS